MRVSNPSAMARRLERSRSKAMFVWSTWVVLGLLWLPPALFAQQSTLHPLVRVVDMKVGSTEKVELSSRFHATVTLLDVREARDPIRQAIRKAEVDVEVNGEKATIACGNYNLPTTVSDVDIDCTVTGGYRTNSHSEGDAWNLDLDARLRLWPKGYPFIKPGTFVYPVKQRWFASHTQMSNQPVYVDGGEVPSRRAVYYHSGLDVGGAEGLTEIVAATDGLVVSLGGEVLPGQEDDTPISPRYDVIYLLDRRGWYYRYSHLHSFADGVELGKRVRIGQPVGLLGKEGASGGWAHLHFEIKSRQPNEKWGTQEGYAFLWDSYHRESKPELIAVARPHSFTRGDETVMLDGRRSWSKSNSIKSYEWTFTDGSKAEGAAPERTYKEAGVYSEVLKVSDRAGHVAYDFAVVQVVARDAQNADEVPPTLHAAHHPTTGIQPGTDVTFKVRAFRTTHGKELWDFGDGSPTVEVQSDGNTEKHAKDGYAVTTHTYDKPGDYIARVERTNERGETAIAGLHIHVDEPQR